MSVSTTVANNNLRTAIFAAIKEFAAEHFEADCRDTASNTFMMPVVNENGDELFATVTVTIPRGTRNENKSYDAYDGYAAAEDYAAEVAKRADEAAARKEKNARKKHNALPRKTFVVTPLEKDDDNQFLDREVTV